MQIGRVMGHATATVKHPTLNGWRLLLVQLLTADDKPDGEPQLMIDTLGAAVGSLVVASSEGAAARELMGAEFAATLDGAGDVRLMTANGQALRWTGRVLAFDDVRHRVNGHGELILLPSTVVTPLAEDQLREQGVRVLRESAKPLAAKSAWGIAQERSHPLIDSAVRSLEREGVVLQSLPACDGIECRWAQAIAACLKRGDCCGGVIFCGDPGLICCVANKTTGVRAVAVTTVTQAARATLTLGANVLAVEMPGRTFFEIRQILRTLCLTATTCPPDVAATLQELDGHAHR